MNFILPATADNAESTLSSGITAASTSIVLDTGGGDLFPTPIIGSATSAGDSDTLNSTGIQAAGVAVGDFIENVTDGSHAYVTSVDTNTIETTTLQGGSDNTWSNSDDWAVNRFVVTINKRTTNTEGTVSVDVITQSEKVLIKNRSGDTLSVATGGRGYDDSTAASFASGDYVSLFDTSLLHEGPKAALAELAKQVKAIEDDYLTSANIDDTAYGAGWNGDTNAPTKNAVYDILASIISSISEANSFFGSTDITGEEAETLTDGSNANALHTHGAGKIVTGSFSYNFDASTPQSGSSAKTGVGFQPSSIILRAWDTTNNAKSEGFSDGSSENALFFSNSRTSPGMDTGKGIYLEIQRGTSNGDLDADITMDADGFTIDWDMEATGNTTGSGGTVNFVAICF
jgi:hypothetical protein